METNRSYSKRSLTMVLWRNQISMQIQLTRIIRYLNFFDLFITIRFSFKTQAHFKDVFSIVQNYRCILVPGGVRLGVFLRQSTGGYYLDIISIFRISASINVTVMNFGLHGVSLCEKLKAKNCDYFDKLEDQL